MIRAESRKCARVAVVRAVVAEIEGAMRRHGLEVPEPVAVE